MQFPHTKNLIAPSRRPRPYPPADASALVAALTRFSHLTADTIVNGGATSHLAPTDPADRKLILVAGPGCVTLSHTGVFTVHRGPGFALGRRPGSVGTFLGLSSQTFLNPNRPD